MAILSPIRNFITKIRVAFLPNHLNLMMIFHLLNWGIERVSRINLRLYMMDPRDKKEPVDDEEEDWSDDEEWEDDYDEDFDDDYDDYDDDDDDYN